MASTDIQFAADAAEQLRSAGRACVLSSRVAMQGVLVNEHFVHTGVSTDAKALFSGSWPIAGSNATSSTTCAPVNTTPVVTRKQSDTT